MMLILFYHDCLCLFSNFGHIGFDKLINVIYNKRLENIPKILETPYVDKDYPPYKYEIKMIKNKNFFGEVVFGGQKGGFCGLD